MDKNLNELELLRRKFDLITEHGWRVDDIVEFTNMPREQAVKVFREVSMKHRTNRFDHSQIDPTFIIRHLYNKSANKLKIQIYKKMLRIQKKAEQAK